MDLEQQSPIFLAPETGYMEDNFSMDRVGWGGKRKSSVSKRCHPRMERKEVGDL